MRYLSDGLILQRDNGITTLGTDPQRVISVEESYGINHRFVSSGTLYEGQYVKLQNDGTVAAVAAVTDIPLGRVVSTYGRNADNDGKVTVAVPFTAIQRVYADGNLALGDVVAFSGYDGTSGLAKAKKVATASSNFASGVVIANAGSSGATTVVIGVYRTGYIVP